MKLADIFKEAIAYGVKMDPRGDAEVKAKLKAEKKKYDSLSDKEKKYFDTEQLTNPYSDSGIIYDNGKQVKSVITGIDMEVGELLLADRLTEKGEKIDAVIAHHPSGRGYARLYDVMGMQADIFNSFGVTISAAEELTAKRSKDVSEKLLPANHYRPYDAAKLLDIPLMNMHTPADNCVAAYLQKRFDNEKPASIGDIIDMLLEEPEYAAYAKRGVGPVVLTGGKSRKVKKVFVDMTGGTEGAKEIYQKLSDAGVDTVVGMHFSADHKKAISAAGMNSVIAGHISSDVLGMNLQFDNIEKKLGKLKIYDASGFIRFERNKKAKS